MSAIRRTSKKGFTLVEILIVVIILGILAAIVIPQFTNASNSARQSNLASQLQTLRSQIELYKLQHTNEKPPALSGTDWSALTGTSTGADGKTVGPYMEQPPTNPLTNTFSVSINPGTGVGWYYDANTGEVHGIDANGACTDDGTTTVTPIGG